jgi:hypothetical protein
MGLLKGLLHRHHDAGDDVADDDGPVWQELPELELHDVRPNEALAWAKPAACPSCGQMGYLDRIDIVRKVTSQHCPWCWTKWDEAFEE